ncbi:MAG: Hint domain-containing protein [Candidatus Babeliaceae bacterium]|jgi:hypothetical protein
MKRFLFFALFVASQILGHGFGQSTLIKTNKTCQSIDSVCRNVSEKQYVTSYDIRTSAYTIKKIKSAGVSTTNCYCKIWFDECFDNDDVICTPTQEFYAPILQKWVSAYQLKVGDQLLGAHQKLHSIARIKFIKKPLIVYSLEIKKLHNFLVGRHAILTHNMLFPVGAYIGLSVAFGSGATTGGTAGSFFGPITCAGGIVIGGLIGVAIQLVKRKGKLSHYVLVFDANNIEKHLMHHADRKDNSGEVEFNNSPTPCGAGPEDPDPRDPRNRNKKAEKNNKNNERKKNTREELIRGMNELKKIGFDYSKQHDKYRLTKGDKIHGKGEWINPDRLHNEIEVWDKCGRHLGAIDPATKEWLMHKIADVTKNFRP